MVDGTGLENRRTRKGTGGSNPSLSAKFLKPRCLCTPDAGPSRSPLSELLEIELLYESQAGGFRETLHARPKILVFSE